MRDVMIHREEDPYVWIIRSKLTISDPNNPKKLHGNQILLHSAYIA